MNLLVTAGPTREPIDEVRFLSNHSTGRQGIAIAREASRRKGWEVTLVCGPTAVETPAGCQVVSVQTASQMHAAVLEAFPQCDALVMAAAVADYRPTHPVSGKIRKSPGPLTLELERTVDILAECGRMKTTQALVGFALEASELEQKARRKLQAKHLDLVVANTLSSFGTTDTSVLLLHADGTRQQFEKISKDKVSFLILNTIETLRGAVQKP